ncbi:hypothetical protein HED60_12665 [Planctomycetales bacterium ZRK34]|nr:hypothetical protein HED60_12665 [Planctomycetales bacterium ZRK34]
MQRIRRLVVVTLIAIFAVSLITLFSGGLDPDYTRQKTVKPVDTHELPPGLEGDTQAGTPMGLDALGTGEGAWIQRADPQTGLLKQEFFYESLTPQEQGVFEIVKPQARFYVAPWRVIHMKSDEGRFVAPDNHPLSGEFRKNIVVTAFECDEDESIDLSPNSPHRLLEFHIADSAHFDTVQGEIKSDSDIELVTPVTGQVTFKGKGMRLVYNELNRRIEYMEITQGKSLHYDPNAKGLVTTEQEPTKSESTTAKKPAESTESRDKTALQYYRVTFADSVKAVSGQRTINADHLVVFFTMDRAGEDDDVEQVSRATIQPGAGSVITRVVGGALMAAVGQVSTESLINVPPKTKAAAAKKPLVKKEEPVTLTWSGKMIMVPVAIRPQRMAEGRDTYLRFEGEPVTVGLGGPDERMVCRSLDFLQSTQRVGAEGSEAYPLQILSPRMGTLSATSMQIELATGVGRLEGSGWIRSPEADKTDEPTSLPPGFRIAWSDHVDLELAGKKDPTRLKKATFHGDVQASDQQFKLKSKRLATEFTEARPGDSSQQLSAIEASGDVHVKVQDGTIEAAELRIMTEPEPDGRLAPARLIARGDVVIVDPQQQIAAQVLDVTLAKRPAANAFKPDKTTKPAKKDAAMQDRFSRQIEHVTAMEDVRLTMRGGTTVRGDKLVADAVSQKATLFGSPVSITRGGDAANNKPPQTELHVLHLNIEKNGRVAFADGAGKFIYTEPDDLDAEGKVARAGQRVKVTWTKQMRFVDDSNTIHVVGDVEAQAEESPTQINKLSAGHITLEMINTSQAKLDAPSSKSASGPRFDQRQLQHLTARDDVVVLSTKWLDPSRKDVATRFRLAGPILDFEDLRKIVTITGAGTMLIEDYRPDDKKQRQDLTAAPVSGRGVTAFSWSRSMSLNETEKTMAIEGQVLMRHRPPGSNGVLELQAARLTADMKQLQDVKPIRMPVERMDIDHIEASGGVQVRDATRVVSCDNLYFDGDKQIVILTAAPDRWVTITRLDQAKPLRAKRIEWNLKTDRLEILDAGR